MRSYLRNTMILLALGGLVLILTASKLAQANDRPRLRVVHAAPGIASIDVYADDNLFFSNIFYQYLSDYVPLNPGDHTIRVRPGGTNFREPTLLEVNAPFSENQDYTVMVAGRAGDLQYWRLDDNNELPGEGSSRVRIVHASRESPTVEFCLQDVCHILAFRADSGYFLMAPGSYLPKVRLNGTDTTFVDAPPLRLQDNAVHTIFLVGRDVQRPTLQLRYTLDAGYPPPDSGYPSPGPDYPPPPLYPPVSGAFLSPQLIQIIVGSLLVIGGGGALWLRRRQRPDSQQR